LRPSVPATHGLYVVDTTQIEQLQLLATKVRARIAMLEEQRIAVEQTLSELKDVERMTTDALAAKVKQPRSA
jgi:hypothetical protein